MELTLPPPSVRKVCLLVTPCGRDVIKRRKSTEIRVGEWPTGELSAQSEAVNSGPEHVWHAGGESAVAYQWRTSVFAV